MIKTLIYIIISAFILTLFVFTLNYGWNKQEKAECYQWQEDAQSFPDWYATDWQEQQCEQHGINL